MKDKYRVKKTKMHLQPGSSGKYYKTWSGTIDFDESLYKNPGNDVTPPPNPLLPPLLWKYSNNVGSEILIRYKPALVHSYNGGEPVRVGRFTNPNQANDILCEVKELYTVLQPDNTVEQYEGEKQILFNDYENAYVGGNATQTHKYRDAMNLVVTANGS